MSHQTRAVSFRVPFWMVILALIPLGVFFASLLLAAGVVGLAVGAVALFGTLARRWPRAADSPFAVRRGHEESDGAIELDPSEYHRIPDARGRD